MNLRWSSEFEWSSLDFFCDKDFVIHLSRLLKLHSIITLQLQGSTKLIAKFWLPFYLKYESMQLHRITVCCFGIHIRHTVTFSATFSTPFRSSCTMSLISRALLELKLLKSWWWAMLWWKCHRGSLHATKSFRITSVSSSLYSDNRTSGPYDLVQSLHTK